jgi:hypothetical protein
MITWNGANTYNVYLYTHNGEWAPVDCRTSGQRAMCLQRAIEFANRILADMEGEDHES